MAKKKLTSKKAKNGIEGTMGGLTDIGFNYNGAWGGTMAMGGGIPGAVGFTYARTGSIPSNGPYAKKTKASAQNGMEMKYYQEGLDWTPRNISRDGSEIPQSQFGTMLAPITSEDVSRFFDLFSVPQKAVTKVVTGKYQTPSEAMNIKNPVGAFATDMILDPLNIMGGTALASKAPKASKAIVNATKKVTNVVKPSKVVKKLIGKQLNEKLPTGTPISTRALASDATITEEGNRLLNRLASPEGKKRLKNQFKLADPELTDKQLDYLTATRLNEINTAVNYNKSRFYLDYGKGAPGTPTQNVPFTEYLPMENAHFSEINLFPGIRNLDAPVDLFPRRATPPPLPNVSSGRFNLAKPTVDDNLKAFADPNYRPGSIALGTGLELNKNVLAHEVMHAIQNKGVTPVDQDLLNLLKPKNTAEMLWRAGVRLNPELKDNLKYFTTSGGRAAKSEPLAFLEELRNRMLNRGIIKDDYEKITPGKLAKARLDAFRQVDKNFVEGTRLIKFTPPWKYGKLADIMNVAPASVPVVGAAALLGDEEQPPKQEEGGEVKKDNMGYWNPENWGEPVEIGSNEITMDGVYEPLLGISDTGDVQMMYPGEDYTFDGETVTEYPVAKGGISVNEADAQPIKKLDQLLNFTNYNDMAKAKKGKKLSKADLGQSLSNINTDLGGMGGIGGASTQLLGGIQQLMEERKQRQKTKQFAALSDVAVQAATSRPVGIQRRYIEQPLVEAGSPYGTGYDFLQMEDGGFVGGNPTEIQNMYNPGDLYSDLGFEPLSDSSKVKQFKQGGKAFYGMETTGNTTTASPFNTSSFSALGQTLGSFAGGGGGQQSGAGQVGSAVGGIAGNLLLPGVGGVIGSALGGAVGGIIGGQSQKKMEQMQRRAQGNLGSAALQQSLQGQFSGFMEDGGELKYLSHDWQPQVITKFGEYDMKDLLKAPKDAEMLRAGGHLKNYTPPSERAMQTYAMGGELQTHWGGYAEPISENPYLPDGGETVMFRGQSHEESDGKGRTGIGVTYGDNPVEVERGEPAVKLKDGGTGEDSMVVFGNMKIPSYGVSELNDPKAKGVKFKKYAEGLSKIENKANKVSDKALKLIDETDGDDQFGLLSLSTANVMLKGSDMKLKDAAMKKQLAAGIQSAILDTAEELGLENDALAKGRIKPMKNSNMAKFGAKMETAQNGIVKYLTSQNQDASFAARKKLAQTAGIKNYTGTEDQNKKLLEYVKKPLGDVKAFMPTAAQIAADDAAFRAANPQTPLQYTQATAAGLAPRYSDEGLRVLTAEEIAAANKRLGAQKEKEEPFNLMDFANQLNPYIRPLLKNPLDPAQLAPEMMALATNVVEPVQAQQYVPMLEQTSTISFQDQLNEIQAEANAARRMIGNNPAGQAAIAAQAANAKNKVLGEQMRTNQMLQLESRRRNLATLNDATLKNLGILDQQFMRQSQAKSATKAQAQMALSSIADKIGRNKAETLQANVMSNMYPQYTFGPKGRVFNTGLTTFNIPENVGLEDLNESQKDQIKKMYEKIVTKSGSGEIKEIKEKQKTTSRNGSIVKAIKNL